MTRHGSSPTLDLINGWALTQLADGWRNPMELVSQHAGRTRATTGPLAQLALVVTTAIAVAIIAGAFVWTAPRVSPTVEAEHGLLDPALIQVREGERESGAVVTRAPNYPRDPSLIELRRGGRAPVGGGTADGRRVFNRDNESR
jgi:hypothetical protein